MLQPLLPDFDQALRFQVLQEVVVLLRPSHTFRPIGPGPWFQAPRQAGAATHLNLYPQSLFAK